MHTTLGAHHWCVALSSDGGVPDYLYILGTPTTGYDTICVTTSVHNEAVIDRRLRPRCCHPESYYKRARKVVPCVRWPPTGITAHSLYSQAQGCVCTALQLGGDVEQPWLMSIYDVIHKTGST